MYEFLVVSTTVEQLADAETIAQALVSERLAACVQQQGKVTSTYYYDGEMENSSEYLLTIKTTASRYKALEKRLVELHPYELPEIIAVSVRSGLSGYLDWIEEQTC
jgi:periplasmic divalent cation tolerance protein